MHSFPIWLRPTILQYDGLRVVKCGKWQEYCKYTYDKPYSLTIRSPILAWTNVIRVTPLYDKDDLETSGIAFFIAFFGFYRNFCITDVHAVWYTASDTSTLLAISVPLVYILSLQDTGQASYSVPPWRNIFETLLSWKEIYIDKHDPTLHCTPLHGVCPRPWTVSHLSIRSPYNRSQCNSRRCMKLQLNLDVGMWSAGDLFALHYRY